MAIIKNIQIDHFPLLGKGEKEYFLLDLSTSGKVYKNQNDQWRNTLIDLTSSDNRIPYGGYLENRFFYSNEDLFGTGDSKRDIHLGVDLWVESGTDIFCPFDAKVHSMAYNKKDLDYGYTVILKHKLGDLSFYSLYGHLSDFHVSSLKVNESLQKGTKFCEVGSQLHNGNWPPHLHFQIIIDIENYVGDYPGVCSSNELEYYIENCPDGSSFIF